MSLFHSSEETEIHLNVAYYSLPNDNGDDDDAIR